MLYSERIFLLLCELAIFIPLPYCGGLCLWADVCVGSAEGLVVLGC